MSQEIQKKKKLSGETKILNCCGCMDGYLPHAKIRTNDLLFPMTEF